MPSFLGEYTGSANNRTSKFERAVNSFIEQEYKNKELIIVSDGCELTNSIYQEKYSQHSFIKLVKLSKQPLFSGYVRQEGINKSTGDIICYLDSDDIFYRGHLSAINVSFELNKIDWCYYNDILRISLTDKHIRNVEPEHGLIGTSSIAHKRISKARWSECDGYGHDWKFIQKLMKHYKDYKKVYGCNYIVCHSPNMFES